MQAVPVYDDSAAMFSASLVTDAAGSTSRRLIRRKLGRHGSLVRQGSDGGFAVTEGLKVIPSPTQELLSPSVIV